MRDYQGVNSDEWRIADGVDALRRSALEAPPSATEILRHMKQESESAALADDIKLTWQASCEQRGYARLVCQVPLSCGLFDQFFNGRTGYRAQYYRSPDCGGAYNRVVVHALSCAVKIAYGKYPLDQPFEEIERSLLGNWSKVWVVGDGAAFDAAPVGLQARRWVEYWKNGDRGLRIPLPPKPQLDLKGTFINSSTQDEWVDPLKVCRSIDIYKSGWT